MSSTFTKESNSSSSIFRLLPISVNCVFWYITSGGLTPRSGTEFTWSPQLRNLAEWDWVPFSFKTNMAENADMEGRWVFARFWVFPRPNIKKRFSRTFLMEFLDIKGVIYEQSIGDYSYRDSASRQVQLYISFVNFRASNLVSISYIFPPTVVLRTLSLILNICYELTII